MNNKSYRFLENESAAEATDILLKENYINDISCQYIEEIEGILSNPADSLKETQNLISTIEKKALDENDEAVIIEFLSYAETAKSSLEFWNDNIEVLDENQMYELNSRGLISSIKDLWNKNKHRLGMMAASDAAGAAAGAATGAAIGSTIPGVGSILGASIGATVAGAASSSDGYKNDCVCITIPLTKIKVEIMAKGK